MTSTPTFTLRLHTPERAAIARIVAAGKAAGRATFAPSDAVRAALTFAALEPDAAISLAPVVPIGRPLGLGPVL